MTAIINIGGPQMRKSKSLYGQPGNSNSFNKKEHVIEPTIVTANEWGILNKPKKEQIAPTKKTTTMKPTVPVKAPTPSKSTDNPFADAMKKMIDSGKVSKE